MGQEKDYYDPCMKTRRAASTYMLLTCLGLRKGMGIEGPIDS